MTGASRFEEVGKRERAKPDSVQARRARCPSGPGPRRARAVPLRKIFSRDDGAFRLLMRKPPASVLKINFFPPLFNVHEL